MIEPDWAGLTFSLLERAIASPGFVRENNLACAERTWFEYCFNQDHELDPQIGQEWIYRQPYTSQPGELVTIVFRCKDVVGFTNDRLGTLSYDLADNFIRGFRPINLDTPAADTVD